MSPTPRPASERFWEHVDTSGDCWLWLGGTGSGGYGRFRAGRMVPPHRFAYELLVGPIPDGYQIDHLCRVPGCVNPAHLEPVTPLENTRRAYALKTHCKNGHEFTETNIYRAPQRPHVHDCRTCRVESDKRR